MTKRQILRVNASSKSRRDQQCLDSSVMMPNPRSKSSQNKRDEVKVSHQNWAANNPSLHTVFALTILVNFTWLVRPRGSTMRSKNFRPEYTERRACEFGIEVLVIAVILDASIMLKMLNNLEVSTTVNLSMYFYWF